MSILPLTEVLPGEKCVDKRDDTKSELTGVLGQELGSCGARQKRVLQSVDGEPETV